MQYKEKDKDMYLSSIIKIEPYSFVPGLFTATKRIRPSITSSISPYKMKEELDLDVHHFEVPLIQQNAGFHLATSAPEASTAAQVSLLDFTFRLQHFGETSFTAAVILAMIQASLALYQYRSNPIGQLIFPPGFTYGFEDESEHNDQSKIQETKQKNFTTKMNAIHKFKSFSADSDRLLREKNEGQKPNAYARILFKTNRMLFLLFPWIAKKTNYLLVRNSHLFHTFFIVTLASAFDFWRPKRKVIDDGAELSIAASLRKKDTREQRVVVIGDSLAIGIGCVETFDSNKNQAIPMYRVENMSKMANLQNKDNCGPVFPKVFAQTLSRRLRRRVRWRSAGVDGGDVDDIRHFCAGVVQEEAEKDKPPDVVVIICGINDLKKSVSNPFKSKTVRGFRASLETLISEIRLYAPNTSIVFPALPVQTFHKNSAVNIFPLSFFLDAMIGFWDSQKKLVADKSDSVMYLGLTTREILAWYDRDETDINDDIRGKMLISSDGIHPNKRCYSKWAEEMANKFCDALLN